MIVDFGEPLAALFGASAALITIAFTAIKWRTWQEASRAKATKIGKAAVILAAIYMCYASFFNSTPDGTGCQSSAIFGWPLHCRAMLAEMGAWGEFQVRRTVVRRKE